MRTNDHTPKKVNRSVCLASVVLLCAASLMIYTTSTDTTAINVLVQGGRRKLDLQLTEGEVATILEARADTAMKERGTERNTSLVTPPVYIKLGPPHTPAVKDYISDGGCIKGVGGSTWYAPVLPPSHTPLLATLNLSLYQPQAAQYLNEHLEEMMNRTLNLTRECRNRHLLTSASPRPIYLLHHTTPLTNLLWCPVYQVAPTEWMKTFLDTTVGSGRRGGQSRQDGNTFKKSLRVLLVRHPLRRLVATYLDVIKTPGSMTYQSMFGKTTYKGRKKKKPFKNINNNTPSFNTFIKRFIEMTKLSHSAQDWLASSTCWLPYWLTCNVCEADYDLVLKVETLQRDRKFLRALVTGKIDAEKEVNLENIPQEDTALKEEVITKHLRQLDKKGITTAMDQYVLDNVLFNYYLHPYLHYIRDW